MDIKELPLRVAQLERDISAATQKLINEFEGETTLQVTDIKTDIHCVEAMGEPIRFIVGETKVDLNI